MKRARTLGALLVATTLAGGCASVRAAERHDLFRQARTALAAVHDAADLTNTVHEDPRVLHAVGLFLEAADDEGWSDAERSERFRRLMPTPPWEWVPGVEIRKLRSGLYLVAMSMAASGTPSSLHLFDGPAHVMIDAGESGTVEVVRVQVDGDRVEVVYVPTPSSSGPHLTSAVIERRGTGWRVDRDTPYRRVTALLARVPPDAIRDPRVHRHPLVLEAFGLFLDHAGGLDGDELHRHMGGLFADPWHQAWPSFDIVRIGLRLYVVTIALSTPVSSPGSLYLFDGASYVTLASGLESIVSEDVEVGAEGIVVTYSHGLPPGPRERRDVLAVKDRGVWRVSEGPARFRWP